MDKEVINNISKMLVKGNRLELPTDIQFTNYAQVKKILTTAGGKYSKCGFTFTSDAQAIKTQLVGGEAINDKKKFQFFATPKDFAYKMVELADINENHTVLEPSAGQGAIVEAIEAAHAGRAVLVELMPENCEILRKKGYSVIEQDFLTLHKEDIGTFDRIVANPPFSKNQDVDHIQHMYKFLAPGGVLVSIASTAWRHGTYKKHVAFLSWLKDLNAEVMYIPVGTFKESGTNVASTLIRIYK